MRDVPREVVEEHGDSLEPAVLRRARHVVEEVERTFAARAALRRHDLVGFGARMTAAHRSLANLFEVSVPELDCVVDTALAWEGVLGSRLTGAGFGGCAVVLLAAGASEGFEAWMVEGFRRRFGSDPTVRFFDGDPGPREVAP